jgi:TolB protein
MKRFFCFLLLFSFLLCVIIGCFVKEQSIVSEFKDYNNTETRISLKYPSNWKADERIPYLGNQPSRYSGTDGFFAVNVISNEDIDLEAIATREAESGDYGIDPQIKRMIHNARIGYLIFPSSDQRAEEKHRSCFITELRNVYRSNQINYNIFLLFADQDHLMQIIETLEN